MSSSPCAACKCLRRKCTSECIFAPYFRPDQPEKFACVHEVFGASNISKILAELNPEQRKEAVDSLVYEAQTRIQNPIYGCVGLISLLQQRLKQVTEEVGKANQELSLYEQNVNSHPQQMLEAQDMMRMAYEQQQMQQVLNNQMMSGGAGVSNLGLGNYQVQDDCFRDMQLQTQGQLLIQGQRSRSDEGPSIGSNEEYLFMPYNTMLHNSQVVHPQQMLEAQDVMRIAYERQHQQQQIQQAQDDGFRDMQLQAQGQLLIQGQKSGSGEGPSTGLNGEYLMSMPHNSQGMIHNPHSQQMLEAQDMMRMAYEQQHQQQQIQQELQAKEQLQTHGELLIPQQSSGSDEGPSIGPNGEYLCMPMPHNSQVVIQNPHPQQMLNAQDMMRMGYEQHQHQQQQMHQVLNNQMMSGGVVGTDLGLGNFENDNYQVQDDRFRDMQLLIQRQSSGNDSQVVIPNPQSQQMLDAQGMMRIAYEQQQIQRQVLDNQMMIGGAVVQDNRFRDMQLQTEEQLLIQRQRSGSNEGPSTGPSS